MAQKLPWIIFHARVLVSKGIFLWFKPGKYEYRSFTRCVFTYLRSQLCYRCEQHGHNLEKKTHKTHLDLCLFNLNNNNYPMTLLRGDFNSYRVLYSRALQGDCCTGTNWKWGCRFAWCWSHHGYVEIKKGNPATNKQIQCTAYSYPAQRVWEAKAVIFNLITFPPVSAAMSFCDKVKCLQYKRKWSFYFSHGYG